MTFEEFFKKKRIDLAALEKAEPALFAEFKAHFEQMGEKSFDHTKKYWFNKLRRQYQLAPEIKTEKPHIANPLAEQTITESLGEKMPVASTPKMGFTPKFKAGSTNTIVPKKEEEPVTSTVNNKEETTIAESTTAPKLGFTPKFKTGITKPAVEQKEKPSADEHPSTPASKLRFTPKFKAGVTKPVTESKEEATEEKKVEEPQTTSEPAEITPQEPATKPAGFTPRFKMKPKEEQPGNNPAEEKAPTPETDAQEKKPAYKPRFIPPKKKEE